jgi:phosphoglycerol transferase MdoB-like AlkP superfamily enzyme
MLCFLLVGRLVFWITFRDPHDPLTFLQVIKSFYIGFKFDLRLSLLMVLPLLFLGGFPRFCPAENKRARSIWKLYFTCATVGLIFFYILDIGYFAYLQVRVDSSTLRFLENPLIAAQMVYETYPLGWLLIAAISVTLVLFMGFGRLLPFGLGCAPGKMNAKQKWPIKVAFWLLVLFGLYGKFSWYPLRWSDAFWSSHSFASCLSSNPVLYFYSTFKNRELLFDPEITNDFVESRIGDYLGLNKEQARSLEFTREYQPPKPASPLNVIMVIMESFASYKTGMGGNPLDPTPIFDRIAEQGVLFPNFFTPHMGTARGLWATITGIPDIEIKETSSRNPMVINQRTIINDFAGYEKLYFLGGSMNWANIRGLLTHNIPDLQIFEEGSYNSPRVDGWGLSDLSLFKEADAVLSKREKPFFAIIQTSGNHRPFTIPEDNEGFQLAEVGEDRLRETGFISNKELNAFRLFDHSLGHFMGIARQQTYFENTLFVFFGDHGLVGYAGDHSYAHESQLELNRYRVPLLFYSPKLLKPQVMEKVASQIDVLPSIAHLAGIHYKNTTLGRNLFNPDFDSQRYAFTMIHERKEMGLLNDSFYLTMNLDGTKTRLQRLRVEDPRTDVSNLFPKQAEEMAIICLGLFETANYLRYHNGVEIEN